MIEIAHTISRFMEALRRINLHLLLPRSKPCLKQKHTSAKQERTHILVVCLACAPLKDLNARKVPLDASSKVDMCTKETRYAIRTMK